MAREDTHTDEMAEEHPAPGTVVRHRGADVEVRASARGPASVELHRGAAWLRATPRGPGLVLGHGAATLQLADGAAVVEVHDFEALVVVLAGRATVRGVAALPRSVEAGEAVTLTLDGSCSDPDHLAPAELAADRVVVENLALDALAGRVAGTAPPTAAPDPGAAAAPSPSEAEAPPAPAPPAPGPGEPGAEPAPAAPPPAPPAPPGARRGAVDGPPPEAPRPSPARWSRPWPGSAWSTATATLPSTTRPRRRRPPGRGATTRATTGPGAGACCSSWSWWPCWWWRSWSPSSSAATAPVPRPSGSAPERPGRPGAERPP